MQISLLNRCKINKKICNIQILGTKKYVSKHVNVYEF